MDRHADLPDHEHLVAVYENMVDGILIVDGDGVIVCANPAATRMLSGQSSTLVGTVFGFPVADRNAVVIDLFAFTDRREARTAEMRVAKIAWLGEPAHLLSLRDITAQTTLMAQLDRAANYDSLTGLPNRSTFEQRLDQAIQESRRHGGLVAALFIDVDALKSVNDAHGHAAGDALLEAVGTRLSALLRREDTVARFAGDEFTVVLTHLDDPQEAEVVADKIVTTMATPFDFEKRVITTGVSIGIALFPLDSASPHDLVRKADIAMYEAKHRGRGRYMMYSAMDPDDT